MIKGTFMVANQGVSQTERWLDTLVPEYVKIDSRDIADLINYIHKISPQFNYYNSQNEIDGTWKNFLTSDPYLLTLLISRIAISEKLDEFEKIIKTISNDHLFSNQIKKLSSLFTFLFDLESEVTNIQKQLKHFSFPNDLEEIIVSIKSTETELLILRYYYEQSASAFESFSGSHTFPDLSAEQKHAVPADDIFAGGSDRERILNSLPYFKELFNAVFVKFNYLVSSSKAYFSRNLLLNKQFKPQIALLLGFLDLYGLIRAQMNGINRRHLDYYYKQLLQLKQKHGHPDSVHLIIEPEAGTKRLEIKTSDLLIAEGINNEEALTYHLNITVTLTLAEIVEIKTIFVSSFKQIISNIIQIPDLIERQVYQATQKLFEPGKFLKNEDNFPSWPALGEDQHEQLGDTRTMEDSDIGLHIASPLFYLPEGKRKITIKIYLKSSSYDRLTGYFSNVAELTNKKVESVVHELLSNAFVISYTSTENWRKVKNYYVKFDKEKALEIIIELDSEEPAIDNFNKKVHFNKFDSRFPIIRLGLNNFNKHHPYSFFRKSEIKRIIITSKVEGFRSLVLQNNIGLVSVVSPFEVFGPQPIIGSFLDIRNSNVFNRYLIKFSIDIDWLNLPREIGGFEAYYKEYEEPFKNESFAVLIKTLKRAIQYSNKQNQQQKPLFSLKNHGSYLDDHTVIDEIDFSKLEFLNEPSLSQTENYDISTNEGGIRLELCSPPETFGQKSFPQIFPKAVMSQAKKSALKQELPKQPIVPIIKSLSIDYTLEYSETFDGSGDPDDCNIQLIHDYPFGYEYIYPNKYKNQINFMPLFSDYDNLCIGLKQVEANSELNILFKFEDHSFHYTLHDAELITWSYLENNNWINFRNKDVLFDTTNNFITSGIVRLCAPSTITLGNTIMNPDLFWIKASTGDKTGIKPRIIGISLNGATATRRSSVQNCSETTVSISPGRIKGFEKTLKGVNFVWQPFPSLNGRAPETTDKFYVRISERLRHKQRPIQIRDITQVVLEEFPQILMVKCFNTEAENYSLVPGTNLHLVLIPKELKKGDFLKETPQVSLSTLFTVKSFLHKLISPFVKIEVGNPIYEKVKIICKVALVQKAAGDSGHYIRELTNEINHYIAPWLQGKFDDFKIGNRIYKSDLLMFIKSRPYISHVTGFSVIHFYNYQDMSNESIIAELTDTALEDTEYIVSSSPASVLIPSQNHIITLLENPANETAIQSGIGNFIIGEELIIADGQNKEAQNSDSFSDDSEEERFSLIIIH